MKTAMSFMRRIVNVTKSTKELPPLRQIMATFDYYANAKGLNNQQRAECFGRLCDALMRLTW